MIHTQYFIFNTGVFCFYFCLFFTSKINNYTIIKKKKKKNSIMLLVPWSSQDSDWMTRLFSVAVDNSFCCECMVFFSFHHISTVLLGSVWVTAKAVQTFIRGVAPVVARPDQDRVHESQNTRQRVHALSSIITSFLPKSDPYQNWRGSFNFFMK